jgi:hypothetical protein
MQDLDTKNSPRSGLFRHRALLLCLLVPFVISFAAGAKFGWYLIEKHTGHYLRDTGNEEPASDFYYAASMTGLIFGVAGAVLGLSGYGCYRAVRKVMK